jgi:murein tripeptide amidase MpaA
MNKLSILFLSALFLQICSSNSQATVSLSKQLNSSNGDFTLTSENTNYKETGKYSEIKDVCYKLALKYPRYVACKVMGFTAEKREIYYLISSKQNVLTPQINLKKKLPVVFIIAGTHAGEIDGKDASLLKLRELLGNKSKDNPLNKMILVWIPVFNVDGHEHRGRFQRPNQEGPFEQGERTTARRINLNRDWMLAQTREMKSMLSLINEWNPAVTIDLHVTDGLRFRHDVSLTVSPEFGGEAELTQSAQALLNQTLTSLGQIGHHPIGFYPRLLDKEDPKAGLILDVDTPRNSHTYAGIRNRIGILVEDYAWESYPLRVKTCLDTIDALLKSIESHSIEILKAESNADELSKAKGGSSYSLDFEVDVPQTKTASKMVDILGYKYDILDPAPIVGGRHISYKLEEAEIWHTPFYDDVHPIKQSIITLPESGYLIPLAWAEIVKPYLDLHQLSYKTLKTNSFNVQVQAIRLQPENVVFESSSFQGRQMTYVTGEWGPHITTIQKGSIFVPINQAKSNLVAHLLEPKGPDSMSSWGLFNTAYEISDYVANHRAFELINWMNNEHNKIKELYGEGTYQQLPKLKSEYEQKMLSDESFRVDPSARLNFWISALPQQDLSLNLYPIFRAQSNTFK